MPSRQDRPDERAIVVRCPKEPPTLTPVAARMLLVLLLGVAESRDDDEASHELTA